MMLQFFRNHGQGGFVKGFLVVLMLIFVSWGFGSFLGRSAKYNNALVIGDETLTEQQWYHKLGQQISFRERIMGRKLTDDEINDRGFRQSVAHIIMQQSLIAQQAKRAELLITDQMAAKNIAKNQTFRDKNGKLDRVKFDLYLRNNNLTERQFFDMIKSDMQSKLLLSSIAGNNATLEAMEQALLNSYYALHSFDIYKLKAKDIEIREQPTDTELMNIYKRDQHLHTVPETRNISYLLFSKDNVEVTQEVTQDEIEAYYTEHIASYSQSETRELYHIVFDDEQAALQVVEDNDGFDTFKKVAENKGIDTGAVGTFALGTKARDELLPIIADKVFEPGAKGLITQPVKTQLGWHLFFINDIIAAKISDLSEVKDDVKQEIMALRHDMALNQLAESIDRELLSDIKLETVAEDNNLTVKHRAFMYGNALDDTFGKILHSDMKAKAEELSPGQVSGVSYESSEATYYVVRLDETKVEYVKDFETVQSKVFNTWKLDRKDMISTDILNELSLLILENPDKVADFIAKHKIEVQKGAEFNIEDETYPPAIANVMLSLLPGKVSKPLHDAVDKHYIMAHCLDVKVDESAVAADVKGVQANLTNAVSRLNQRVMNEELYDYLLSKYKIKSNDAILFKELNLK